VGCIYVGVLLVVKLIALEMLPKDGETRVELTFSAARTLLIRNYSVVVVRHEMEQGNNIHGCIKVDSQFYHTLRLETVNFPTAVFFFCRFRVESQRIICGSPHYGIVFAPCTLNETDFTVL
jgi:hypothetical protein